MTSSNEYTEDELKALEIAITDVAKGMEKVSPIIDSLTSSRLKTVLKTVTHVCLAEEITKGKKINLTEEEQMLIDKIFKLQEDVMGYLQLNSELEQKYKKGEEDGQE